VSRAVANSVHQQCLSIEQEEVLIRHINTLTRRGLPLTNTIVQNLAEEMISRPEGKTRLSNLLRDMQTNSRASTCAISIKCIPKLSMHQ
jgi:hypothetical protein